ncbi:hypothetical protein [Lewinella sp. LCG006]|uniref:hypothetical protein n=1 Tax=Lewinella sp. LCG006 TaxID=3231911 RepID=UPI00345F3F4A
MLSARQLVSEIKLAVNEASEDLQEARVEIVSFDVSLKVVLEKTAGIGAQASIGPIKVGARKNSSEERASSMNITFIPKPLDAELQGSIGEELSELIVTMAKEIQAVSDEYPEFGYSKSFIELYFTITEKGDIKMLFEYDDKSQWVHSIKIYFSNM